jgi:hypothetical protein
MNTPGLDTAPPLTVDEERDVEQLYEERADYLELETFPNNTALTDDSEDWIRSLTGVPAPPSVGATPA